MRTTTFHSRLWLLILAGALVAPAPLCGQTADTSARTIFARPKPWEARPLTAQDTMQTALADSARPAIPARVFEAISAPYVAEPGELARAGSCSPSDSSAQMVSSRGLRYADRVAITRPDGSVPAARSRFLLARRGPELPGHGVVLTPTAVVQVEGGALNRAVVIAQFEVISCGSDSHSRDVVVSWFLPDTTRASPALVSGGPSGRVIWIDGSPVLPTLQDVIILDIGSTAGVKAGDLVALHAHDEASGEAVEVARAAVVRAGSRSASAVIVRQSRPAIAIGLEARVVAKLP